MNIREEMIKEIMSVPGSEYENLLKLDLDDLAKCYVSVVSSRQENQ